ncbi:MAG: trigger factor [Peptostreptococcaceae bacterium]|nr:trigger factor [Peptostreptococcaceae bacterium]
MKSTFVSREKNDVKFTMEFTAEEFEQAVIKAYQENKGKFALDGFRKGKAPRKLIETQYGEDVFFEDAINNMFSENYPIALDELSIDVIDKPKADFSEIEKGKDFTITINVEAYPEIEVKDYKGVKIEKSEFPVTDEDVNKEIEDLRKKNARLVLADRCVKDGDMVLLDYMGFVGEHQFDGGTAERYSLKIGSNSFIPGFEEQLIDAAVGEERDVKITFPEEYHSEDLAGKEAIFKCKVHEIKEEELPELNDEFAKDVSEFDTLEELKAETKLNLEKAAEARALNKMKNSVIEKVFNANEVEIPKIMVEEEIDAMMNEFKQQLSQQGLNLEQYFEYLQKDAESFREDLREEAAKKVKTRTIIAAVAKAEAIEVAKEEIDQELELMAIQYKLDVDKIREMLGAENFAFLEKDIKIRKAVDFMYENAVIEK